MNVDLAVLTPAYLDYTFVGLEALPGPGEERFAGDMLRSPGGGAITAVGARRLGLTTMLVAPLGDDLAGRFVRLVLEEEGVEVGEPRGTRTPTTVVMPVDGERSMVTVDPGVRARASDLEPLSPRAVAATLEQIDVVPRRRLRVPHLRRRRRARVRWPAAALGEPPARADRQPPRGGHPDRRVDPRGGGREARHRCGYGRRHARARRRRSPSSTAARWRSPASTRRRCSTPPVRATCSPPRSLWGDLLGADAEVALGWANLYAGLSVCAHTGTGGAVTRERLADEGARRGMPPLPEDEG